MAHKSNCLLLFAALFVIAAGQYYTPYNPYNTPSPTFSSLTGYYYTTPPPPYYNPNNPYYNDMQIRIWPYVIGQYLYPSYYNNYNLNPYAYPNNLGKK
ncbi:GH15778 [Drosophila grimshawi]|uniref:GH15778 n=2 Tax=Drosophila grimshawi TaxID=7222 RepID=B4IZ48_DROGR|nr:GH15778 [Drosophila grimshawi]